MKGQTSCRHCNQGLLRPILWAAIQLLEEMLGCEIICTSGCRCKRHNSSLPLHSKTSQHLLRRIGRGLFGNAVDVTSNQMTILEMYWAAVEVPLFHNGGIGLYFNDDGSWWIHLDGRGYRARWAYHNGKKMNFDEALRLLESKEIPF